MNRDARGRFIKMVSKKDQEIARIKEQAHRDGLMFLGSDMLSREGQVRWAVAVLKAAAIKIDRLERAHANGA